MRVAARDPVPVILAGALLAFLMVAVVKPWPDEPRSVGPIPPPAAPPVATASPTAGPLADLRRQCEEPLGWRVFTIEEWSEGTVRVWRGLEPSAHATGPLDPTIPVVPLGPLTDAVGYCSPWEGSERPPADGVVTAWSVQGPGATTTSLLRLVAAPAAPHPANVLGALFAPPASTASTSASSIPAASTPGRSPNAPPAGAARATPAPRWPAGRYVFNLSGPAWSRWWAVEVSAT